MRWLVDVLRARRTLGSGLGILKHKFHLRQGQSSVSAGGIGRHFGNR